MSNQRKVWVVEMLCDNGQWLPCDAMAFTKRSAQLKKSSTWEPTLPDDKFRVSKYVPEDSK